jgi:hypothetical protein
MPLTLTSRDKAYVRAVAHGGLHDMYSGNTGKFSSTPVTGKMMIGTDHDRYIMLHLGNKPKSQINRTWHDTSGNSHELQDIDHDINTQYKNSNNLYMFNFSKDVDVAGVTKYHNKRYGDNVFLDSTSARFRVIMPHDRYNADENTFGRFIIFRSKEKQNHIPEESMDHANPHYDLFLDAGGFENGLNGYVKHIDSEDYVKLTAQQNYTAMQVQNFLINKKKYVVMKDCKFNLGKDFGALAFETSVRWDWNDQMLDIPAARTTITCAQSGDAPHKNYEWYILVLAMDPNGSTATQILDVDVLATTKAKTMD